MFGARYYNARKLIFFPNDKFYAFKKPLIEPTAKYQYIEVTMFILGVSAIA